MKFNTEDDASFTAADLVRTFAWRAGVAIIILAVVIGIAGSWVVQEVMRAESIRASGIAADALLRHELTDADLTRPLPEEVRARIDEICANDLSANGIIAVKVWRRDGMLLYSSDQADRIGSSAESGEVLQASQGNAVSKIAKQATVDNATQFERVGPVVEVYRPLRDGAVVELYQSFTPIAAGIEQTRTLAWLGVLALAVPAYIIELQIVRRAARKLARQDSALEVSNERLAASLGQLEAHTLGTLSALAATVDAKDSYTARHALMVADYAQAIGRRLDLDETEMRDLERACLLHDIGKIAVPESILLKPGRLTGDEFRVIKEHAAKGAEIVASIPFLASAADAVRHHHERCDGKGYPDGLAGEDISLLARIIAVADTFDAMTSNRPYRPARTLSDACAELKTASGTQLCPRAVDAFLAALEAGEISVGERHLDAPAA